MLHIRSMSMADSHCKPPRDLRSRHWSLAALAQPRLHNRAHLGLDRSRYLDLLRVVGSWSRTVPVALNRFRARPPTVRAARHVDKRMGGNLRDSPGYFAPDLTRQCRDRTRRLLARLANKSTELVSQGFIHVCPKKIAASYGRQQLAHFGRKMRMCTEALQGYFYPDTSPRDAVSVQAAKLPEYAPAAGLDINCQRQWR